VLYPINTVIHEKFMNKFGLRSVA
jgi:hypothetical protein